MKKKRTTEKQSTKDKARRGAAPCCAFATPPGDTLRELLNARGISQTKLARAMVRPIKTINEIIKAKARITEYTAIELELVLGVPARFWLDLEMNYRLALARKHNDQAQEPRAKDQ